MVKISSKKIFRPQQLVYLSNMTFDCKSGSEVGFRRGKEFCLLPRRANTKP